MVRGVWLGAMLAGAIALVIACSKQSKAPISPTGTTAAASDAASDGTTLKATAPSPQAPIKGAKLEAGTNVVLAVSNSTAKFASGTPLAYRFQIFDAGGAQVYNSPLVGAGASGTTSHAVTGTLEGEKTYQWQARAEYGGAVGPWSARESFVAPANDGYIKGGELYDPLMNGRTVGEIHGPVTFIPGVGVKLETLESYISYQLPETLLEGEYSLLVTGMPANTKGGKTKLFAMAQGYSDIVTNDRRFTVEKRGDPPGIVAWRMITHDDQIDTEGAERRFVNFQASQTYLWRATWRNNAFNLIINEGGASGPTIYDMGKNWHGRPYDPNPHVVYVGAPVGRSGPEGASVQGAIIRQVWVSGRSRPDFANK
jgi:hypothetical protein